MLRSASILCVVLLLAVPSVAADNTDGIQCKWDMGAIDLAQCIANGAIDTAQEEGQSAVRTACIIVFGSPC